MKIKGILLTIGFIATLISCGDNNEVIHEANLRISNASNVFIDSLIIPNIPRTKYYDIDVGAKSQYMNVRDLRTNFPIMLYSKDSIFTRLLYDDNLNGFLSDGKFYTAEITILEFGEVDFVLTED